MIRAEVINRLMPRKPQVSYLEVGVQFGITFDSVEATTKVAVDPRFLLDLSEARADDRRSHCTYHEITSDEYFSAVRSEDDLFDVIFLDGLHTFDQTLKDLLSAICCVKPDGIIIVDDVMPVSFASSISDHGQFLNFREKAGITDGSWMGDVYKIPFFVRQYMPLYSFATIQESEVQMVFWKAPNKSVTVSKPLEQICRMDYSDFMLNKDDLNMRPIAEVEDELAAMRSRFS